MPHARRPSCPHADAPPCPSRCPTHTHASQLPVRARPSSPHQHTGVWPILWFLWKVITSDFQRHQEGLTWFWRRISIGVKTFLGDQRSSFFGGDLKAPQAVFNWEWAVMQALDYPSLSSPTLGVFSLRHICRISKHPVDFSFEHQWCSDAVQKFQLSWEVN